MCSKLILLDFWYQISNLNTRNLPASWIRYTQKYISKILGSHPVTEVNTPLTYLRFCYIPHVPASSTYVSENSFSYISDFLIDILNVRLACVS